jgi:hypothetical protein
LLKAKKTLPVEGPECILAAVVPEVGKNRSTSIEERKSKKTMSTKGPVSIRVAKASEIGKLESSNTVDRKSETNLQIIGESTSLTGGRELPNLSTNRAPQTIAQQERDNEAAEKDRLHRANSRRGPVREKTPLKHHRNLNTEHPQRRETPKEEVRQQRRKLGKQRRKLGNQ